MSNESTIRWEQGEDGIVVLTLDDPSQSANTMNAAFTASLQSAVTRLEADVDTITGVIITSAKKTFFAGGDLNELKNVTPENASEFGEFLREAKAQLVKGVPIWMVYAKGPGHAISETAIRSLLRENLMIDTKVASVSAKYTALRFIYRNTP